MFLILSSLTAQIEMDIAVSEVGGKPSIDINQNSVVIGKLGRSYFTNLIILSDRHW